MDPFTAEVTEMGLAGKADSNHQSALAQKKRAPEVRLYQWLTEQQIPAAEYAQHGQRMMFCREYPVERGDFDVALPLGEVYKSNLSINTGYRPK